MANIPVLTDEQWQEARRCAEIGLTLKEVAEDFGVSYDAVRQRALREDWLTVNRLEAKLADAKLGQPKNDLSPNVADCGNSNENKPSLAPERIEKRLLALHTANKLGLARAAGKGIETALELMDSGEIKPANLQDIKTLADIAKIAWGGDAPAQAVQVNVLSSQPMDFQPHFEAVIETGDA